MDIILCFLNSHWFTALASLASICSLGLSIAVLFNVRKIRGFYVFTARVPPLLDRLEANSSDLSRLLNDFAGFRQQIRIKLGDTQVVLESLRSKVPPPHRQAVRRLAATIKLYDMERDGPEPVRTIYIEILKVAAAIQEYREDIKWER